MSTILIHDLSERLLRNSEGEYFFGDSTPFITLGHELIHAQAIITGTVAPNRVDSWISIDVIGPNGEPAYDYWDIEEFWAIGLLSIPDHLLEQGRLGVTENDLRREHGINLRGAYSWLKLR